MGIAWQFGNRKRAATGEPNDDAMRERIGIVRRVRLPINCTDLKTWRTVNSEFRLLLCATAK